MLVSENLNFMSKRVLRRLINIQWLLENHVNGPVTNWHDELHLCWLVKVLIIIIPKKVVRRLKYPMAILPLTGMVDYAD